nr:MAG TPA: hypothetical protein [Bacteriophage sp.]
MPPAIYWRHRVIKIRFNIKIIEIWQTIQNKTMEVLHS